jgi:hypothetical protein
MGYQNIKLVGKKMTITIIQIGEKEIKCGKCLSHLKYNQLDVKEYEINHDYLGDYDTVYGIKCPVCSNIVKDK